MKPRMNYSLQSALVLCIAVACSNEIPEHARHPVTVSATRVRFDLTGGIKSVPWPNDALCWFDDARDGPCVPNLSAAELSPTQADWVAAINATRGWSPLGSIVVPFERSAGASTIDFTRLLEVQRDADWSNDAIYLIDLETGLPRALDFPTQRGDFVLNRPFALDPSDPRQQEPSLVIETVDERPSRDVKAFTPDSSTSSEFTGAPIYSSDRDSDSDGSLDVPIVLRGYECPNVTGQTNGSDSGRALRDRCLADGIVDFYEPSSDVLRLQPRRPLEQHRQYAVVMTDRLIDENQRPVGSPFSSVSHPRQQESARRVIDWMTQPHFARFYGEPPGNGGNHVQFLWTFTTSAPRRELNALAKKLQPDLFASSNSLVGPPTSLVVERNHSLDIACNSGSPREGLAELLSEVRSLSPGQHRALVESLQSIASIATGTWIHAAYSPFPNSEPSDPQGAALSRVPFWLAIPRNVPLNSQLAVVLVSPERESTHFEGLRWAGQWANRGLATMGFDLLEHDSIPSIEGSTTLAERFKLACIEDLLLDLGRTRQDPSQARSQRRSDISPDLTGTRDRWRASAIELASMARSLRSLTVAPSVGAFFDAAPAGIVGIGNGASPGALAATLLEGAIPVVLVDPATSPDRAWRRGSTWGSPSSDLWQIFGPRLAGVTKSTLNADQTQCTDSEVSIRLIASDTTSIGVELACMPLFDTNGARFANGATVIATNLSSLSRRCVKMAPSGRFSLGLPAATGDSIVLAVYDAAAEVVRYGRDGSCNFKAQEPDPAYVLGVVDSNGVGTSIITTAGGLGLERQSSEFSQALDLAAAAFSLANPAPFLAELAQPANPQATGGLLLSISPGDPTVTPDEGMRLARAAGLVPRFPPESLLLYPEIAAETTPEVLAKALPNPTPAAHVEWARLDEGVPRLRRFPPGAANCGVNVSMTPRSAALCRPPCSVDADCSGYMMCGTDGTCVVPSPTEEICAESLPDLDGLAGSQSGFGAFRPVPFLRLARYSGRLTAERLGELWDPQSRQLGPLVQPTRPDLPFVAMALPLVDPLGSHGIPVDDICQRFRFGNYIANLVGQFVATGGKDYPPVTDRKTQQCLADFPDDTECLAALQDK